MYIRIPISQCLRRFVYVALGVNEPFKHQRSLLTTLPCVFALMCANKQRVREMVTKTFHSLLMATKVVTALLFYLFF